ncbi:hypothetical protein NM208_g734 [Fusarium decemcellulare]|uniref:Uncharacterized protein n=2 Tax=Fusarium decemcellulare TaxID=57161 RepID=A0ACC1SK50_9HYPO|nr:hypothetical protein NM208_g4626 [Fusarium decemcellulare]KAJ3548988.1 hypothetical protein NM208_g734 [Fusarium decemcellulare]
MAWPGNNNWTKFQVVDDGCRTCDAYNPRDAKMSKLSDTALTSEYYSSRASLNRSDAALSLNRALGSSPGPKKSDDVIPPQTRADYHQERMTKAANKLDKAEREMSRRGAEAPSAYGDLRGARDVAFGVREGISKGGLVRQVREWTKDA